jgi:hypothetical protein
MTDAADLRAAGAGRWSPTVPMSAGDLYEAEPEIASTERPESAGGDESPDKGA